MFNLEGLSEPAPPAVLAALQKEVTELEKAGEKYRNDESNRPPASLLNRNLSKEARAAEVSECGSALSTMLYDSLECRLFIARRRLLLAQYGLDDDPNYFEVSFKVQPERLGALLIASFLDRLCCVDPRQSHDAGFHSAAEETEIWWSFCAPKEGLKRWRARREAAGLPREPEKDGAVYNNSNVTRATIKKVRHMLYPNGEKPRRPLTPAEAHEALRAVHAEINGEPPHAISMLMKLDVDNLTPVQALSTLKHLQEVARRRDIGPRLFDEPEGD